MAYIVTVTLDIAWVGDGTGMAMMGQNQSNEPGFGSALAAGPVPSKQSLRLAVNEGVPGADAPTQANFNTALTQAATDLGTLMGTAGAFGGNAATPLALAQAWATGGV